MFVIYLCLYNSHDNKVKRKGAIYFWHILFVRYVWLVLIWILKSTIETDTFNEKLEILRQMLKKSPPSVIEGIYKEYPWLLTDVDEI